MYKRILVPLDGSDLSESALPYAQQLAEAFSTVIDLVYAVPTDFGAEVPNQVTKEVKQDAEAYLLRIADSLPKTMRPRFHVNSGHPAEVIIDEAENQNDTLVVMATHGYSGLKRWVLGSVAHKVVQVVKTPVLLIPAGAKSPDDGPVKLHRVVVPLDGSVLAENILPPIMGFCAALELELVLVRAYNPMFPGSSIRMHDISKIVHDSAENYIKGKAAEIQGMCEKEIKYAVLRGIPAEQITDFSLQTPNSFTAMCTHGRHGPGRWMLGSVTDAVIHCSEEPVLVIRGPSSSAKPVEMNRRANGVKNDPVG